MADQPAQDLATLQSTTEGEEGEMGAGKGGSTIGGKDGNEGRLGIEAGGGAAVGRLKASAM
jgi:hypothetical protein